MVAGTSFGAANLLVYFYMPPQSEATCRFSQLHLSGRRTGHRHHHRFQINFGGPVRRRHRPADRRLVGPHGGAQRQTAAADRHRRPPFALLSFLIFYPPVAEPGGSTTYGWWDDRPVLFLPYALRYSIYCPDQRVGALSRDRMLISTVISVVWALGFLMGSNAYLLQSVFEKSFSSTQAFQLVISMFPAVLVFMLVPVFSCRKSATPTSSASISPWTPEVFLPTATSAFPGIRPHVLAGCDIHQLGSVTLSPSSSNWIRQKPPFSPSVLFAAFCFTCRSTSSSEITAKRLILAAFLVFSLIFALTAAVGWLDLPRRPLFYLLAVLSGFPLASFGIIPNAIIADVAHQHQASSGHYQPGVFYAVRNFMMKAAFRLPI